jgi:hypothetical protein
MKLAYSQQGPGHPGLYKISIFFKYLRDRKADQGAAPATAFSARRQDLPFAARKAVGAIASRECRLY